ncbi:MAG: hypothetical protein KDH94_06725, partial [Coxiellaceae bacterium]|nr:hypothetical protein [Coxiellaceae bacterium]
EPKKTLLRAPNKLSFHFNEYATADEARKIYCRLIDDMCHALALIQQQQNPIFLRSFVLNFKDSAVGCMEARIGGAIRFVAEQNERGFKVGTLEDLVGDFYVNRDQAKNIYVSALAYFHEMIEAKIPVLYNGKEQCLTWLLIQDYFKEILNEVDWPSLRDQVDKPLATYQFNDKWYYFRFSSESNAQTYLTMVKCALQAEHADLRHAEVRNKFSQHNPNAPYYFQLTQEQMSAFVSWELAPAAQPVSLPKMYLLKSLRFDKDCFVRSNALHSLTPSPHHQLGLNFRRGQKGAWVVTANGVEHRSSKPRLAADSPEKTLYSKKQSTTLVIPEENILPPIFGKNAARADKLAGVILPVTPETTLLRQLYIYDGGTVGGAWRQQTKEAAESYRRLKVEDPEHRKLFFDLDEFREHLKKKNPKEFNEVLAKLNFRADSHCCVGIFSDTLAAKMIALEYARLLRTQLRARAKELGEKFDHNYQIPIVYYLPEQNKIFTPYTLDEQKRDIEEAKQEVREGWTLNINLGLDKLSERKYELLLAYEDTSSLIDRYAAILY